MKKNIFVIPLMIILVLASMAASPKPSLPVMIDLGRDDNNFSVKNC